MPYKNMSGHKVIVRFRLAEDRVELYNSVNILQCLSEGNQLPKIFSHFQLEITSYLEHSVPLNRIQEYLLPRFSTDPGQVEPGLKSG